MRHDIYGRDYKLLRRRRISAGGVPCLYGCEGIPGKGVMCVTNRTDSTEVYEFCKVSHCRKFVIQTKHWKRKRKRFDSVLWQKPLHQQKFQKGKSDNTNNDTKKFDYTALRSDLGRSVGVTTATELVWLIERILKGKRNAYCEFLNVGFILRT